MAGSEALKRDPIPVELFTFGSIRLVDVDPCLSNGAIKNGGETHMSWSSLCRAGGNKIYGSGLQARPPSLPHRHTACGEVYSQNMADLATGSVPDLVSILNGARPARIPAFGLPNNGNTCFVNVVVQSLMHIDLFYRLLSFYSQKTVISRLSSCPTVDTFLSLMDHVAGNRLFSEEPSAIATCKEDIKRIFAGFLPALRRLNPTLPCSPSKVGALHQEDAHEFLTFLIDALHEESKTLIYGASKSGTAITDVHDWHLVEKGGKASALSHPATDDGSSPVSNLFTGSLQSVCTGGTDDGLPTPPMAETFRHVSLNINHSRIKNVKDAFRDYFSPEVLSLSSNASDKDSNPLFNKIKSIKLTHPPPVIVLHLKLFDYDSSSSRSVKVQKIIHIDDPLTVGDGICDENVTYRLKAVIFHHGDDICQGHYTCTVLSQDSAAKWVHIDDMALSTVDPPLYTNKPNSTPYILIYESAWA